MKFLPNRQQGLTLISTVFILVIAAFFILAAFKILPIYLNHSKVSNALKALESTPGIEMKTEYEIRDSLAKRFNMNYVYDVNQDDIKITKQGGYLRVVIAYEVAKKMVGNLSVLAEFNDVIEVGQQ